MKLIKFKIDNKFKYKRKIIIKDLILKISVGIHKFEKKKKQRVKFSIDITSDPKVKANEKKTATIINYETVINRIILITKNKHHNLLEDLAENIFDEIFKMEIAKKIKLKIEKIDIIKNTSSVGVEIEKSKI